MRLNSEKINISNFYLATNGFKPHLLLYIYSYIFKSKRMKVYFILIYKD
jgi:hypothetical protein